ncbi:MAG: hypothetical protein K8R88_01060 [Armatimonadetes bacterium]|nr:hypothetical protein [Armatimonadota bacterium]
MAVESYLISKADFDLPLCVTSGQTFRWALDGIWRGVSGSHWFEVQDSTDGYRVTSNATNEEFNTLFRINASHTSAIEALRQDPLVGSILTPGLRLIHPECAVETLFSFLCTSNNHIARITTMVNSLARYGQPICESRIGWTPTKFPSLERLSDVTELELRSQGFGYRARTIPRVADEILKLGGKKWLRELAGGPYEDAVGGLLELSGVGPKLADCIALYALHHTEAVPVDTHLWQASVRYLFPEWGSLALSAKRYREIGDRLRGRFGVVAGFAQQHLFVDNLRRGASLNNSKRVTKVQL